jgi:hypothetical protein
MPWLLIKPRFCNRKSIASRNFFKHGHVLDFSFHRRGYYAFKENLAGMLVFIRLSPLITIFTVKSGLNSLPVCKMDEDKFYPSSEVTCCDLH